MIDLQQALARYEALRDRDRSVASMQSKQQRLATFNHLLDTGAREQISDELKAALADLRAQARALALELARRVFVDLHVEDLGRVRDNLRRLEAYLDEQPHQCLDACYDLLTLLRERGEIRGPLRLRLNHDDP